MRCTYCKENNDKDSKFCQKCGKEIVSSHTLEPTQHTNSNEYVDVNNKPYPYIISNWKLITLCIATFGLYEIYWFYRHWKSFNAENGLKRSGFVLLIYSLFSPISSYFLFKHISKNIKDINKGKGLEA